MAAALAKNLESKAQLHIINNAPHSITNMDQLQELHNIIKTWLIGLE
jgi:hypothetical protein